MGCDGGTIAGRKDLVKVKGRSINAHSSRAIARAKVNSCALSQQPLRAPVVACAMGQLLNKDALIEYLLAKQRFPHFSHITSLKDVCNVTMQWNEQARISKVPSASSSMGPVDSEEDESKESNLKDGEADAEAESLYSCPITALTSNGVNKFVAMQPCGCIVSERALRSIGAAAGQPDACLVCGKPLSHDSPVSPSAGDAVAPAAAAAAASASSSPSPPFHHPSYRTLFPGAEETLWLRAQIAEKMRLKELEKAAKKAVKKSAVVSSDGAIPSASGAAVPSPAKASASSSSVAAASSSAAASAAPSLSIPSDSSSAPLKRKADGEPAVRVSKKSHSDSMSGAHATLVSSRTGNTMSDHVRSITAQAAAAVAERRKDSAFNAMFLTQKQIDETRFDSISTKPSSLMSLL
jgi:hypothetical protein